MLSARVRLYHFTKPEGIIYTDQETLNKALANGWVDSPFKVEKPVVEVVKPAMTESRENTFAIAPTDPGTGASFETPWAVPPVQVKESKPGRPFKKGKGGK